MIYFCHQTDTDSWLIAYHPLQKSRRVRQHVYSTETPCNRYGGTSHWQKQEKGSEKCSIWQLARWVRKHCTILTSGRYSYYVIFKCCTFVWCIDSLHNHTKLWREHRQGHHHRQPKPPCHKLQIRVIKILVLLVSSCWGSLCGGLLATCCCTCCWCQISLVPSMHVAPG